MKPIYKYILIWPNGNIHHYIAHTITEVAEHLTTIKTRRRYNIEFASIIKRPAYHRDFYEPNNVCVGNSSPNEVITKMRLGRNYL